MTTTTASGPARPPIRIWRAPPLEPPTDDARRIDEHPVCAGQLALFTSINGRRVRTERRTAARQPGAPGRAGHSDGAERTATAAAGQAGTASAAKAAPTARPAAPPGTPAANPPGTPATAVPAADASPSGVQHVPAGAQIAASRFAAACVEVLNGFRPIGHLRALTTPIIYPTVVTQLTRRAVRVRMPAVPDPTTGTRVTLRRIRVFEQRTGLAEAVAVLRRGETSWAIALRFEQRRGAWLCTLLEVV
jgi:Family of unknown function (DUF6459)